MQEQHPINNLMSTVMENIKGMVDVNTIIGDPVETANGTVIIPVSKVGFGFAAGGSDLPVKTEKSSFGGGSGAGVSISPIGFLVVTADQIKLIPISASNTPVDKLIDYIPVAFEKINGMIHKNKSEE